jgi:hypothetical protein
MTNPFFWPGTKIVRSMNNAFDWRNEESKMADHIRHLRQSHAGKTNSKRRSEVGIAKGEPYYITPKEKPIQKSYK